MNSQILRAIAIGLLLFSVALTVLRITGKTNWDLGMARLPVLVVAIALLLVARRREKG